MKISNSILAVGGMLVLAHFIASIWIIFSVQDAESELRSIRKIIENNKIKTEELALKSPNSRLVGIPIAVTAYSPTKDQTDSTPNITASMQKVRPGIIALSRDLEKDLGLKFGDFVIIEGYGIFEFQDRMHKRWKKKADIFMWDRAKALEFGKKIARLYVNN